MSKKTTKHNKPTPEKIKYLSELRIIQTNLVYLCGLSKKYANKEVLFKKIKKNCAFNEISIIDPYKI